MKKYWAKFINKSLRSSRIELSNLFIGVFVFGLLIVFPPLPSLTQFFFEPSWQVLSLVLLFSFILLKKTGYGWEIIQTVIVFSVFAFTLIYKWQYAKLDSELISGLLPWSDANAYLWNAHLLTAGLNFNAWGTRRPIFAGFLSVVLRLTGGNFLIALAVLTLLNAISVYLVLRVIKNEYGALSASVFLLLALCFYGRYAGKTLSEQLGFMLGNLSLFFLLIGVQSKNLMRSLLGLGILTLALIVRAGAFFILPIVCIWLGFYFNKRGFLRVICVASLIVACVFIINFAHVKILGAKDGIAFSNYADSLYGLASGNLGWTQMSIDYPNIIESEKLSIAIQKIVNEPALFFKGIIGSCQDYFSLAFSFLHWLLNSTINIILWAIVFIGLYYAWLIRREGRGGLILASFLGVVSSLILLPPRDADYMRVFAATIPFTILWVINGLSAIFDIINSRLNKKEITITNQINEDVAQIGQSYSYILLVLIILGPFMLRVNPKWEKSSVMEDKQLSCPPGQKLIQGHKFTQSSLVLIPNNATRESYMPYIRYVDFMNGLQSGSSYAFLDHELSQLRIGEQLSYISIYSPDLVPIYFVSNYQVDEPSFFLCSLQTKSIFYHGVNLDNKQGLINTSTSYTTSQENSFLTLGIRCIYGIAIFLVFILLFSDFLKIKLTFIDVLLIVVLFLPLVFTVFYTQGQLQIPFLKERIVINMGDSKLEEANSFFVHLQIDWKGQNNEEFFSPFVLYEDEYPLSFPNSESQDIIENGMGRFFLLENHLWFSSSDNSDPRVNGRVYKLEYTKPIPMIVRYFCYLLPMLFVSIIFVIRKTHLFIKY